MMSSILLSAFLVPLSCLSQSLASGEHAPLVVAHRGASHAAPENTLAAFKLAWKEGADAIEGDFFLTKDQEIVCTHDRTTQRLNKEKLNLDVAKSTLEELRALDVGSWKNEKWKGERMPTLAEVMATVPDGKKNLHRSEMWSQNHSLFEDCDRGERIGAGADRDHQFSKGGDPECEDCHADAKGLLVVLLQAGKEDGRD